MAGPGSSVDTLPEQKEKQAGKRDRREGASAGMSAEKRPGVLAEAGSLALQQHHLSLRGKLYNAE